MSAPSKLEQASRSGVPFADHVGVEIVAGADGSRRARIPEAVELLNHIETVHAGALFTVGETASGMALFASLGDLLSSVRAVTRKSEIHYLKIARGEISAKAELAEPVAAIRQRVDDLGRADFEVHVELADASDVHVASMIVTWNVSKRPA